MSSVNNTYVKTIDFSDCWDALPRELEIKFSEHHGKDDAYGVTWCVPKFKLEKNINFFTSNLNKARYILKNKAISAGGERSALLKAIMDEKSDKLDADSSSKYISDGNITKLRNLHRLEAEISAYGYTDGVINALEKYSDDDIESLETLFSNMSIADEPKKTSCSESVKVSSIIVSDKERAYLFNWEEPSWELDVEPAKLKKYYDYFVREERSYFGNRYDMLCKMADRDIHEKNPLSDENIQVRFKLQEKIAFMEGVGEVCRYSQHLILKKHIEKSPPLEKRSAKWLPTQKDMIRYFTECRGIKYVLHFTQAVNLKHIMKDGLLSRTALEGKEVAINDKKRLDKRMDHICVSVSFPTDSFFYRLRQAKKTDWAVMRLDSSVLWEKDCLFNYFNAATKIMSTQKDAHIGGFETYEKLFENVWKVDGKLPAAYPSDIQAKVMVSHKIEINYVKDVFFQTKEACREFRKLGYGTKTYIMNDSLFGKRADFIEYGGHEVLDKNIEKLLNKALEKAE